MVRWLITWDATGKSFLASGSFLWPLCRVDPDVNRHERRWLRIHNVRGQRDKDLGWLMVGLETMKGALGATTFFVCRVLPSGSLHGDGGW